MNTGKSLTRQDIDINICAGKTIRLLRKKKGLSGQGLSIMIGMSQQQISRYERGLTYITLSLLFNIIDCLDLTIEYFFNEFFKVYRDEISYIDDSSYGIFYSLIVNNKKNNPQCIEDITYSSLIKNDIF